jgi:mannose-6-phosphate isomerase
MDYRTKPIPHAKPDVILKERPWGNFSQYVSNGDCTVSLMTVKPGQRLSLQSHTARSELWIVLDDDAVIQVGVQVKQHRAGDEVWIPVNAKHRLSCAGSTPVRVLEIAFGNWQQTDITRHDDDYARPTNGD